ncbi:MAG: hypothetical protein A2144_03155 [Chloroflexi bacterium RBG_16_50_9]|nr:MAG: hypothetical protein A2144_03155 [Chloroflexi bacterium RBG_16_50_9]
MKLGIILNTSEPETAWNALRLGNTALTEGHHVKVFLLGAGVEIDTITDEKYDVSDLMKTFTRSNTLLGCGTCMRLRRREPGTILKSTLDELIQIITDSDKVISFG